MNTKEEILDLSRQNNIGPLSPWFDNMLAQAIDTGHFSSGRDLEKVKASLVRQLSDYREQTNASTVVLGMSGGVDSALTAALFKEAGYRVIGVTMPIHQVQAETDRGVEACIALGIEHVHKDLTEAFDAMVLEMKSIDSGIDYLIDSKAVKVRRGNLRARLRMITLYNLAALHGGFVASTDNFSELTAGFWTKHGDVGDVSPIQSLWKSWEVPYLAKIAGVPESTWRATPTDGLGIDAGDEAQLGGSYLEWDLMLIGIISALNSGVQTKDEIRAFLNLDERAETIFLAVTSRMAATWFKRMDPINMRHPFDDRYAMAAMIDETLFQPEVVKTPTMAKAIAA